MPKKNQRPLLRWLDRAATIAIITLWVVAATLAYLVVTSVYQRPLHPLAAAEELATATPVGALLPVTPPASQMPQPVENGAEPPAGENDGLLSAATDNVRAIEAGSPATDGISEPQFLDPSTAADEDQIVILLMGVDSRLGYSLVSRTDVLMLIAINPDQKTVSLLSIPRDLYVWIPGHGRDRINTAFVHGSAGDNPAGGAALTMQTVEETLDVTINHYALVDFSALIKIVDMLDGIDVYVPYTIDDPTYPDMSFGYDPLYITEGLHHFDGTMALKYARTRHQDNDFYRAQRQQQVIFAIRRKVMGLGFLDLVNQAPALYKRISSSMFTDLSTEELVQIAHVVNGIREENIHTGVLNYDYVRSHWTDTGSHVLLLKHNEATRLVQEMFGNNP